jgi:hypothetical protein
VHVCARRISATIRPVSVPSEPESPPAPPLGPPLSGLAPRRTSSSLVHGGQHRRTRQIAACVCRRCGLPRATRALIITGAAIITGGRPAARGSDVIAPAGTTERPRRPIPLGRRNLMLRSVESSRSSRVNHSFHHDAGALYKCLYGGGPCIQIAENRRENRAACGGRGSLAALASDKYRQKSLNCRSTDRKIKLHRPTVCPHAPRPAPLLPACLACPRPSPTSVGAIIWPMSALSSFLCCTSHSTTHCSCSLRCTSNQGRSPHRHASPRTKSPTVLT